MRETRGPQESRRNGNYALKVTVTDDFGNERSLKRCKACFCWCDSETGFYGRGGKCKECYKQYQATLRQRPGYYEKQKEYQQAHYQRLKSSPYLWKRHLAKNRERLAERRKKNPYLYRHYQKTYLERVYANPERHKEFLAKKRLHDGLKRKEQGVPSMPKRGLHLIKFPEKESKVKLPVEPIQEWIEQQAAQGMSLERLSTESGVDERQITRMRNGEQNWVSLYLSLIHI